MSGPCRVGLLGALVFTAAPALAHERSVSFSSWEFAAANVHVTARLAPRDVSRLPWVAGLDDPRLGDYVAEHLTIRTASGLCPVTRPPQRQPSGREQITVAWEVTCPASGAIEIRSELLREHAASHLHIARVRLADGTRLERVLTAATPAWALGAAVAPAPLGESLLGFVWLGAEHIWSGTDHLVFLLALLLLGGTLGEVVRIVTGFTVAHSLTLAATVFGLVRAPAGAIEALIGLSVALVATENLWLSGGRPPAMRWGVATTLLAVAGAAALGCGAVPALTLAGLALFTACYFGLLARVARPLPLRAAIAFLFGLVHGFGFAGVLLEAALPSERMLRALFGFNLGVELGQVACVLALWLLLQRTVARRDQRRRAVIEYGSAAILAVGVFWFVSRCYAA